MHLRNFHLMCKPTSYQCNLHCEYCFYLEKEMFYKDTNEHHIAMSDAVLEHYIKSYIDSQSTPTVEFSWQGGEPTLSGLDYFKKIIEYQRQYAGVKTIKNTVQTNGVLINKPWAQFFAEHDFLIGISIDGNECLHDRYRLTNRGLGSFKKVIQAVDLFNEYQVEYNTLTVVNSSNMQYGAEVYAFLKSIGSCYHQYIPVIESSNLTFERENLIGRYTPSGEQLLPFSVSPEGYGQFMNTIFDEWIKQDVGKIFIQLFDSTLISWYGYEASLCVFRKECGQGMIIERNGDIYSCDHYVYPEFKLGNIMTDAISDICNGEQQIAFGQAKSYLSSKCQKCEFVFACNGGCTKHRIDTLSSGEKQNYLCESYYAYFKHVKKYMDYMVNELHCGRSVFDVMRWAKLQRDSNKIRL